jgi:hypothetical protein
MKFFLKKILFFLVPITVILISGLFLPATPRAAKSFLFADRQKDSLLKFTKEPRIIFVGGSNLSFGLNSYEIKDSLNLNPINTAVNVGIGLKYMFKNTLQYVRRGDVIIISPEYELFYQPYDAVSDELLRTVFDVAPQKIKFLSLKQGFGLLKYIPKFSLTKFDLTEYWGFKESDVYSVNSFDKFGDVDAHWNLEKRAYEPTPIEGNFNENIITKIKAFQVAAENMGAKVYITFPCLDEVSFKLSEEKVLKVEEALKKDSFNLLGSAERYMMPKDMLFNTKYHLNKSGLEYRTKLFIEDYKKATTSNNNSINPASSDTL